MSKEFNRTSIPFNKGIVEMLWLSSGCWCVKRKVIDQMVKAYPELDYVGDDNVAGKPIHGLCIPAIFEVNEGEHKFKKYLSEDWAFPLDPNTNILCGNFRWRKIKDINVGEKLISFDENAVNGNQKRQMRVSTVTDKIFKNLPKVKIVTENGNEVITTNEHQWLIKRSWKNKGRKGRKNGTRMVNPSKSYWEKTENLQAGDYLYNVVDNVKNPDIYSEEYMIGYLNGMWDGDGYISKHKKWNSAQIGIGVCDYDIICRVKDYCSKLNIDLNETDRKDGNKKHRKQHLLMVKSKKIDKSNRNRFLDLYDGREHVKDHDAVWCQGYMAGIFDAEGNYDGASISIAQREFLTVVEKIKKYSEQIGYVFKRDQRRFRLCGVYNIHRFFMETCPAVSRKMNLNGQTKGKDRLIMPQRKTKIKEITPLNESGEVICLTTDSGTFIAEGLASHNCHRYKELGGKIHADTSIVLKHHGKIPFSLWNVQVVQKKKEDAPKPTPVPNFEAPKNPALKDVPPVGFDLQPNLKDLLDKVPKV